MAKTKKRRVGSEERTGVPVDVRHELLWGVRCLDMDLLRGLLGLGTRRQFLDISDCVGSMIHPRAFSLCSPQSTSVCLLPPPPLLSSPLSLPFFPPSPPPPHIAYIFFLKLSANTPVQATSLSHLQIQSHARSISSTRRLKLNGERISSLRRATETFKLSTSFLKQGPQQNK